LEDDAMSTDSTISTLNSLIKTTVDSMKGFKDAEEDAESTAKGVRLPLRYKLRSGASAAIPRTTAAS
jgi:hypothetical protein